METRVYIAAVHKDRHSDYGVTFPEVPGCFSAGSTLEEVTAMAEEALALHLDSLTADGEAWPEPRGLEWVQAQPEAEGAVSFLLVKAPPPPNKVVRINITLDGRVLARIDQAAAEQGLSRSAFLSQAALAHAEGRHVTLVKKGKKQAKAKVKQRAVG